MRSGSQAGVGLMVMSLELLFLTGEHPAAVEWQHFVTVAHLLALGSLISSLLCNIERVLRLNGNYSSVSPAKLAQVLW